MAKDYSFDVVCRTNLQEAANAVNQAAREIGTRYDFKGSKSSVSLEEDHITLIGDDDFKLRLVRDILNTKLVKRGISLKNIKEEKKEPAAGGQAKINGDEVRVSGKDKDALQACIAFLKQQDLDADLQFVNYR